MCGFVGIVDKDNKIGKHSNFLKYALQDLHRRGPDMQLTWKSNDSCIEFGFARLAIRDLTEAGNQPMQSYSNRFTIVYNGETYNTDELCVWANINKTFLRGHSDTEIILACIEKRGVKETIQQIDGIFAIALYDSVKNELYLIRDHAGVKPLYMGVNHNGVVFSSHYHHITSHSFFKNERINKQALVNYFKFGFIQEGEGILENTYFLPHSHITTINIDDMKWHWESYYDLQFEKSKIGAACALQDLYTEVVNSQLVSDVPIGCFLSGGVDSTITTGIASRLVSNISAYTIGVDDKVLDESSEASRFASYFDINHFLKQISKTEIINSIDQYKDSLCEPLADFSSLLTLKVCELAKENLTVVLSGDGGDELFWGYPRFQDAIKYKDVLGRSKLSRFLLILLTRFKSNPLPFGLMKYKSFDEYYLAKQGLPGNQQWVKKLIRNKEVDNFPYMYTYMQSKEINNPLDRAKQLEYDIHMQRVLLKVDRASMYHSLEVRTPLLSKKIVEYSTSFNFENCISEQGGKFPLRQILKNILPLGVKNSGVKKGFSPPMAAWMRDELKESIENTIFKIPSSLNTFLNQDYIKELWSDHQSQKSDNSWSIWAIYSLFIWVENKMYRNEN